MVRTLGLQQLALKTMAHPSKKLPSLDEGNKQKDKEILYKIYEGKLKQTEKLPKLSPMMRNASFAERAKWLTSVILEEQTKRNAPTTTSSYVATSLISKQKTSPKLPVMQTIKLAKQKWKNVALSVEHELKDLHDQMLASHRAQMMFVNIVDMNLIQKVLSYSTLKERHSFASCSHMVKKVEQSRKESAQALNEHAQIIFTILSYLPSKQRSKLQITCKKWKNLMHPVDSASELKSHRNLSENLNILPPALDLVFMIDKRSPETSAFHCSQAIKHAVEKIGEGTPGIEIRVGVIVFNKYPDPLEESHWIKGGFPPSAYLQAKACVRKRNSVLDPATGMVIPRFTRKESIEEESVVNDDEEGGGGSCGSTSPHPMLGALIKQPSFLSEIVDEEDKIEIQKSWKDILGQWLIDPSKRSERNKSFVVKRFPFVEYERPTNKKLIKKQIKEKLKLIKSHREVLKPKLNHKTSFFSGGGGDSVLNTNNDVEATSRPESSEEKKDGFFSSSSGLFNDDGANRDVRSASKDSEFDEDEDIDFKMQMRTMDTIQTVIGEHPLNNEDDQSQLSQQQLLLQQGSQPSSSSSQAYQTSTRPTSMLNRSRPSSRGFEDSSAGYLEHLKKRIPHKRNEASIGKWDQVEYKKVAAFSDEFKRWQTEQRAKSEITELIRLARAAKEREDKDEKLYQKLLRRQRRNLKGFELLIENVANILDKNYGNETKNEKKNSSAVGVGEENEEEQEQEEEEEAMNGSAIGAAFEMLLGNQDLSAESIKSIGSELLFRPHATKLCFLISSSSPLALELHSKPPFQKSDPCGFDPIHALHEIADRGIRICPIISKSIQNWDSALGFMQGVAKITESSNPLEDSVTGGVAYIGPSELTAPYILQEVLYAVSKEMIDRDHLKQELLIHMNKNQTFGQGSDPPSSSSPSRPAVIEDLNSLQTDDKTATSSIVTNESSMHQHGVVGASSTAAIDYRTWKKDEEERSKNSAGSSINNSNNSHQHHVIRMSNHFHTQVKQALHALQDGYQCVTWEQRFHDGQLPLHVSKRRLKQFNSPIYLKKFIPPPPSPCELANVYKSSSSTLEAKLVLAEIEAEKVVRAQTVEVLEEARLHVKENFINWAAQSWCERVKICAEARKRIQRYTREMRVAKANLKVEVRARIMQHDRTHNTKFHILLKDLCSGDQEAFAIFLQARVRSFLIRQRNVKNNQSKHLGDDISQLSSYSSNSFHVGSSISDIFGDTKLISDNAFAEITFMSTDERLITPQEAIDVLSHI